MVTPTNTSLREEIQQILASYRVRLNTPAFEVADAAWKAKENNSKIDHATIYATAEIEALLTAKTTEALRTPYRERSQLVAALSRLYESHLCTDDNEPDWVVVCIHTPNGQAGWHISARDRGLFKHLKEAPNHYDGHTTEQKYERLKQLQRIEENA